MDSNEDLPGLHGSESDTDDYEEQEEDASDSDLDPELCSSDEESYDEDEGAQGGGLSNTGIRTGDMKKVAETRTTHLAKKSETKDIDECMDVVKKKVFGPILFGVDEKLEEPWLDAMTKFHLSQK